MRDNQEMASILLNSKLATVDQLKAHWSEITAENDIGLTLVKHGILAPKVYDNLLLYIESLHPVIPDDNTVQAVPISDPVGKTSTDYIDSNIITKPISSLTTCQQCGARQFNADVKFCHKCGQEYPQILEGINSAQIGSSIPVASPKKKSGEVTQKSMNSSKSPKTIVKMMVGFIIVAVVIVGVQVCHNSPEKSDVSHVSDALGHAGAVQLVNTVEVSNNEQIADTEDTKSNLPQYATNYGMILIPSGTFDMGSTNGESGELPVHSVTISAFYMDSTEVTQYEYARLMGTNPSKFKGENLPVDWVSWLDAIKYCNARSREAGLTQLYNESTGSCDFSSKGYRLPTEAEWEYACRANSSGNNYGNLNAICWYYHNSGDRPHTVATKQKNSFGLYDMTGNVYEWCNDLFKPYSSGSQTDPRGKSTDTAYSAGHNYGKSHSFRGGSWSHKAFDLRSASRGHADPSTQCDILGFRVVLSTSQSNTKSVSNIGATSSNKKVYQLHPMTDSEFSTLLDASKSAGVDISDRQSYQVGSADFNNDGNTDILLVSSGINCGSGGCMSWVFTGGANPELSEYEFGIPSSTGKFILVPNSDSLCDMQTVNGEPFFQERNY